MNKKNKNANDSGKKNIALILLNLSGGGAERVASELSCFFVREGHNVFVFTERKKTDYDFQGKIVMLKPTSTGVLWNRELDDLYALSQELKRKKRQYNIDVAISFMERCNLANVFSKGKEKVIVRICTTLSVRDDMRGLCYNRFLLKHAYNMATRVVVLSDYGKVDMQKYYGIKSKRLTVIPNAVIPRAFSDDIPWTYGDKVILSVNRIHPIKQQGILIDAMQEILKKVPQAKLLLVGNDKDKYAKTLKQIVKERELENHVIFTGQVNNVEYYMNHSQVFALTSVTEGFPNVILEAMNQGMTVVSTDFPGPIREILGAKDKFGYCEYGILVPQIDEKQKDEKYKLGVNTLGKALAKVLTEPQILEKYGEASKTRAKYYSQDKIEALWRRVI